MNEGQKASLIRKLNDCELARGTVEATRTAVDNSIMFTDEGSSADPALSSAYRSACQRWTKARRVLMEAIEGVSS